MSTRETKAAAGMAARLAEALDAIDALRARLDRAERAQRAPIAVIGIGCRLPGGVRGPDDFWALLREGRDAISAIPADRFDLDIWYDPDPAAPAKTHARHGGFVEDIDRFDPAFFGLAPREVPSMDPQHRLTLEVAWEALEHAGLAPDRLRDSRTGVFVGLTVSDYLQLHAQHVDPAAIDAYRVSGNAPSAAAGRLAHLLGLRGPSLAIDTACSSSLVAIHTACQNLRVGECDLALAGGVNALLAPENFVCVSKWGMLAPDGRCKTFDARADGFVRGEGCGMIVLKRLADARAEDDRILAVIRGSAVNHDGASGGLSVPNGAAQADVIRRALADAGVDPAAVDFVEAHGTGTALGDPVELEALAAAYGPGRSADRPLCVGAVKTNIGHLESAAGVAGLIKAVLALQHGEIPANLHLETPTNHVRWAELPLAVPTRLSPWPSSSGSRLAGVSSFGFSGTNAHVVIEAAPTREDRADIDPTIERPRHAVTLSARTAPALRALAERYVCQLDGDPDSALADIGFTANSGRTQLVHRLAWTGVHRADLRDGLAAWLRGDPSPGCVAAAYEGQLPPRVGFLFTGQGAQHVGMGRQLYETQPVFRAALDRCAEILRPHLPEPLPTVLFAEADDPDAVARMDDTQYAQPALFALGYALAEMWRAWGIEPAAVLGHSLGELTAACVAGAFSLDDGLRLVAARAAGMGALPRDGAMAAVFAPEDRVRDALRPHTDTVAIAALNGPGHVVISGLAATVETICASLEAEGLRTRSLNASHAFHSPLVEPMLDDFEQAAAQIAYAAPRLPLISNVTGRAIAGEGAVGPAYWRQHARSPVRFSEGIAALAAQDISIFVEIGPRPTLIALGQRCLPGGHAAWLPSLRRGRDDWTVALDSLAALYVRGVAVDWTAFDRPYRRRRVSLPTYPFERRRYWLPAARSAQRRVASTGATPRRLSTGHPLLGERSGSPLIEGAVFEVMLGVDQPAFVADHRVGGRVVLPATAYVEQALAATETWWGRAGMVRDMVIERMLALEPATTRVMQTVLATRADAAWTVEVFSSDPDDAGHWVRHAVARIEPAAHADATSGASSGDTGATDGLNAARDRCPTAVDVEAHYGRIAARGIALGPAFRSITRLWRGAGEALGEVILPDALVSEADAYTVHPALLDACWQVSVTTWPDGKTPGAQADGLRRPQLGAPAPRPGLEDAYMPIAVESVCFHRRAGRQVWASTVPRPEGMAGGETWTVDVRLFAPDGAPVGEVRGLVLKRVGLAAPADGPPRHWRDWLYLPRWEALPVPTLPNGAVPAAVGPAARTKVDPHPTALDDRPGPDDSWPDIVPELDRVCTGYAAAALGAMGWPLVPGTRVDADALPQRLGVAPTKRRLFERVLAILAEDGWLRQEAGDWVVLAPAPDAAATDLGTLRARHPDCATELALLERCGARLADVLAGVCDPLTLLFPEGSTAVLERLYRDSASALAANARVGETVAGLVADWPGDRPLRVLEIGAGTGSTTAAVLPRLPADRTRYVFTDISPAFLNKARTWLGDRPWVELHPLDIEGQPVDQGFEPGSFDLILAANVLHATADLRRTLANVRTLLAPGGRLVLLEGTAPRRWVDLTFGLTDGWWCFTDTDLRSAHPLLTADQWVGLLDRCGFDKPGAMPANEASALAPQAVITAEAPPATAPRPACWLILEDAGGVGTALAASLERGGVQVARVRVRQRAQATPDDRTWSVDPTSLGEIEAALEAARAQFGAPIGGIVDLWSLDAPVGGDASAAEVAAAQAVGCLGALHLAQAVIRSNPVPPPRLWWVTRGCQAALPAEATGGVLASSSRIDPTAGRMTVPAHATLWGLARTVDLEQPELRSTCIDLDPEASDAESGAALAAATRMAGDEDRLALRGSTIFVLRLLPDPASPTAAEGWMAEAGADAGSGARGDDAEGRAAGVAAGGWIMPPAPYALAATTPGLLESLAPRPALRRPPGRGEVELRVLATGLNFRDVLSALGAYPGDAGPLGGECVGEVVALGSGVSDLRLGDTVMAIVPGAFASHVTVHRALAVLKPARLTLEAAATVLSAFVTAAHALRDLACLQAGERVLIHTAAGGVGLAAIQLARRAGAEIFATAGSAAKRAYLRSIGVTQVFSSRSEAFGEAIREATGGRGVDVVLNTLADPLIAPSLTALAPDGRFVELGKRGVWDADRMAAARPDVRFFVVDMAALAASDPVSVGQGLRGLTDEVDAGLLEPLPYEACPLAEVAVAFQRMARGEHIGKLVVRHPAALVRTDATYLITGGFGALGLLTAQWLAARGARAIVLVGHHVPSARTQAEIEALEAAGSRVRCVCADVADEAAMAQLFADIEAELPPLRGVVHAAGVLDDGAILQQSAARFAEVLAPKVQGAWLLHRLTQSAALDFFVLYASASAVLGSPGQANHAAANAFMDALAHHRRALGLPALSLDWGAWSDIGRAARREIGDRLAPRGIGGIAPTQGLAALAYLLDRAIAERGGGPAQVMIAPVDWPRFRATWPGDRPSPWLVRLAGASQASGVEEPSGPLAGWPRATDPLRPMQRDPRRSEIGAAQAQPADAFRRSLADAPVGRRRDLLADFVRERARRVIGLETGQAIEPGRPLQALGLDSLMAIELRNRLGADLGLERPLQASLVFDHPSIEALAECLEAVLFAPAATESAPAAGAPGSAPAFAGADTERWAADLAELSEDEAAAILLAELAGQTLARGTEGGR